MGPRRLYEIVGMICGFVLIDYGFNFIAIGLPGARVLTSQFVGANLVVGGSAAFFISLFFLLRADGAAPIQAQAQPGNRPEMGIVTLVEEQTPSQYRFYRKIEYVGYFFTALGLFAAADLVLQVSVYHFYNETRGWIEVLLVVFGLLGYVIFSSIERIGAQEERAVAASPLPTVASTQPSESAIPVSLAQPSANELPQTLNLLLTAFSKSPSGEYERRLAGDAYDMFQVQPEMVTVWREDRRGMRSVYLAGPYELSRGMLEEHAGRSEEVRVGILVMTVDTTETLLAMQQRMATQVAA